MDAAEFRLPDVGEGLTESEIVGWRVRPGDRVEVNQVIVEIETAKARVELPSPFSGVVEELLAQEGQIVAVGSPIVRIATGPDGREPTAPSEAPAAKEALATRAVSATVETPATLVGYGPSASPVTRRPRRRPTSTIKESPAIKEGLAIKEVPAAPVLAKPPVRFLARERGIDLRSVTPTGAGGTITRDDVLAVTARGHAHDQAPGDVLTVTTDGHDRRVAPGPVRRATAAAMSASVQAPQAAAWLTVDATRTLKLLERLRDDASFTGVPVSPLLIAARGLALAVARHPEINATWDAAANDGRGEIVLHDDVNLGIAAATPRGLLVPVVRAAQTLSLRDLASSLAALARTARAGETALSDLVGGTITITNVGALNAGGSGVDGGVPLLVPGQAAILCVGRVARRPWVHKKKVRPRWLVELTLTFDHRLVDGDLAGQVLGDVAAVLEDPRRALAWG